VHRQPARTSAHSVRPGASIPGGPTTSSKSGTSGTTSKAPKGDGEKKARATQSTETRKQKRARTSTHRIRATARDAAEERRDDGATSRRANDSKLQPGGRRQTKEHGSGRGSDDAGRQEAEEIRRR